LALRALHLAIVAAAAAFSASAGPAHAASVNAPAKAKVVKPLALRSIQDLDLGTLVLAPGSWANATVSLSRTGVLTCPANVTCSGATQVAQYNITGSNKQTIVITAPNVTMTNQADPAATLTLVVAGPGTVTLPNAGGQGVNFPLGGSIELNSTTADGTYVGTFEVTAEYQ
jgi:hypothetical protein